MFRSCSKARPTLQPSDPARYHPGHDHPGPSSAWSVEMAEDDDLTRIEAILHDPTQEGIEELAAIMRENESWKVKIAAADALLHLSYGPPSPAANEALAIDLESQDIDTDDLFREATTALEKLRSRH
jgi:hypothetical protein